LEEKAKRDWLTGEMLKVLKDDLSLGFYRKVAQTVPEHRVFEALSEVKSTIQEGRIRRSPGSLFTHIVAGEHPKR